MTCFLFLCWTLALRTISCFICCQFEAIVSPRPPSSPLGTWRQNSHLAKLIISLTMTLVYHLYDYRFVQAYTCVWQRYGKSSVTQTIISSSCWVNGYLPWRSQAVQIVCRLRHIWNLFKYGKILAYTECENINQMYLCFRCVILTCGERAGIVSGYSKSEEDPWHFKWGYLTWRVTFVVQEWLLWSAGGALIPVAWGETSHSGHGLDRKSVV